MKLKRLYIEHFKNLDNCEVIFEHPHFLNAFIGSNGSGKSNLVEALLQILIDIYFGKKPLPDDLRPLCDFLLEYETKEREISIGRESGRMHCTIDGEAIAYTRLVSRIRNPADQLAFPDTIFAYYSGDCDRVKRSIKRYQTHFRKVVQKPENDNLSPLFVLSTNQQARNILLALAAHRHVDFLERLGIDGVTGIEIEVQSPKHFDSSNDDPILWGTQGKTRKILAALSEYCDEERYRRAELPVLENGKVIDYKFTETRIYKYSERMDAHARLFKMASRLSNGGDNLYLALEHLAARGILKSVSYTIIKSASYQKFDFNQLSEGEKQLIAVIGAVHLTNKEHNLALLDEPDTHLNPQWSWEYPEMLEEAFEGTQRENSTVLMATHDPVVLSGLTREQVYLANGANQTGTTFHHPIRHPRGQGIANLLCSSEYFGLPSSLDKKTQVLMDERLRISLKNQLTNADKERLRELNQKLEILQSGISERDPHYVEFLRSRRQHTEGTQ